MALTHAIAGADCVAPSAMMDGQVSAIRYKLDEHGFKKVKILAYSAKYASSFYGPFRDAIDSKPSFSDRRSYQMDLRNASQAIDEVCADIEEGADSVMVKPAHTYLDILHRIHLEFPDVPLVAYHVSGEYMMIQHAAESGALDVQQAFEEVFYGFKRAGATMIISYYAKKYILSLKKRMTKLNMSLQGAI
jgi:porphobilinogen synthase